MNRVPSKRVKTLIRIGIVTFFILFIVLFFLFFFGVISGRISPTVDRIVYAFLMGLMDIVWLFSSVKKIREKRRKGQRATWYTQPGMLFALATLFFVLDYVVYAVIGATSLNADIILSILLIPSVLLWIASVYFFFKFDEPHF